MKNNNWEKEIREKLDSYSTVELDGLWERVESATEPRRIVFIPWKKVLLATTAAAAILALVIWNTSNETSRISPVVAELNTAVSEAGFSKEDNTYTIENTSDSVEDGISKKAQRTWKAAAVDNPVIAVTERPQPQVLYDVDETMECETLPETRNEEKRSDMNKATDVWQDFETVVENTHGKRKITLLAYGGSAVSGVPSTSVPRQTMSNSSTVCDATSLNNYYGSYSGNVFEQPATTYRWHVGASASIRVEMDLSSRLGLSSGLSWTSLEGEDSYQVFKPTLHYMGVPVWLSYRLLGQKALVVKAVGGPRIDFLVKGSPDIETGPVQLSVHGGLQAEYMLSRWIGLSAGAGADLYIRRAGTPSPFETLSPVTNVNVGLLFKL